MPDCNIGTVKVDIKNTEEFKKMLDIIGEILLDKRIDRVIREEYFYKVTDEL